MNGRNFYKMIKVQWAKGNFVCVGLDPDMKNMPRHLQTETRLSDRMIRQFCRDIIIATKDIVCAYKPNPAFFKGIGVNGGDVLSYVINTIRNLAPDVPIILDAKRGDIENPNIGYAESAFTWLKADAITVNPYLGAEALQPFLKRTDKGIIILCRTSNSGAGEFQDLMVKSPLTGSEFSPEIPLYQYVAFRVANHWNNNGNCALVVGANYPDELREVRGLVGDMPILITGIGFQQKDVPIERQVKLIVSAGKDSNNQGLIINSSRGIIFASKGLDFAEAARRETLKLRELINRYREK